MESLLIGLLYVVFYGAVAALIVYLIIWVCGKAGYPLDGNIVRILWLIWLVYVVILLVRLLFGASRFGFPF